jgi:hypothetical protein
MAIKLTVAENDAVTLGLDSGDNAALNVGSTTVVSVNDYNDLRNKPSIEGVELIGDKSFEELNLQRLTNTELENMLTL